MPHENHDVEALGYPRNPRPLMKKGQKAMYRGNVTLEGFGKDSQYPLRVNQFVVLQGDEEEGVKTILVRMRDSGMKMVVHVDSLLHLVDLKAA